MAFFAQIPELLRPWQGHRVRIGFSGGCDSTALLLLLLHWNWPPEMIEAVHFEHGLRGQASRDDAAWCEAFCRNRGIGLVRVDLHLSPGSNVEAQARAARYRWFSEHTEPGVPVLLAHHADDVEETLFLKLARGGNASSVTGLRPRRVLWNVTFLRPLLAWRKAELVAYLAEQGVNDFREDATNADVRYMRNFLRNQLLPAWKKAFPAVGSGIQQSLRNLACDGDFIEQCAHRELQKLGMPVPADTPLAFWKALHPALRHRVLRGYLEALTARPDFELSHEKSLHFAELLTGKLPEVQLSDFQKLVVCADGMLQYRERNRTEKIPESPVLWRFREIPELRWNGWHLQAEIRDGQCVLSGNRQFSFDLEQLPEAWLVTLRSGGEHLTAWGENSPRSLKHLLTGSDCPVVPLLLKDADGTIYAACGVRRSALAPVGKTTRRTLIVTAEPPGERV